MMHDDCLKRMEGQAPALLHLANGRRMQADSKRCQKPVQGIRCHSDQGYVNALGSARQVRRGVRRGCSVRL